MLTEEGKGFPYSKDEDCLNLNQPTSFSELFNSPIFN